MNNEFQNFLSALKDSSTKEKNRMFSVLENIFSMRAIGNKTHGDLAEVALTEYINRLVDGYSAIHTGKEKFRSKEAEEDISVKNEITKEGISISIKAYGEGNLQLSTDKKVTMFPYLQENIGEKNVTNKKTITQILNAECFSSANVLSLIYNENSMLFKIIAFDLDIAYSSVRKISFEGPGNNRIHPIYRFYDSDNAYIFEVRYGDKRANALQRGMWTHTENAAPYFNEILSGKYEINEVAVNLIHKILNLHKNEQEKILKSLV